MKLRIKILVGFMAVITLMGILGVVTYSNFLEINEQFEFLIEHDLEVLQNAQQLQKHIVDAETGQRGFIIVGEESFLEPYYSGISGFNELVKIEKHLVSDNPPQVKRLERIEGLFTDWNEQAAIPEIELARIAHKTDISSNQLQELLAKGTGKRILDEIRELLDEALDEDIESGEVVRQILFHKISKDLVDREAGQRGFLITGDESFLEPYNEGNKNLEIHLTELLEIESVEEKENEKHEQNEHGVSKHHAAETIRILKIKDFAKKWEVEAAIPEIELARKIHQSTSNQKYLINLITTGTGKGILDETRVLLDEIIKREKDDIEHQILLYQISKDLVDRETGQRGFLITGDESFLEPYNEGNKNLEIHLTEFKRIAEEEVEEEEVVDLINRIKILTKRWEVEASIPEINTRKAINENPTIFDVSVLLKSETGKNILDNIRIEFQEFIQIENKLKDKRFETVQEIKTSAEINIAIFVSIASIVGIGIAITLSHSINKSLKLLILGTERFGKGEFEAIPIEGDDEISALSGSFNEMVQNIEFSNKRLQEMQGAIDLSSVVSITNNDGIITHVNKNFCEVSKYTSEELIGKTHKVIKSKHQSDEFWKEVWDVIKTGKVWRGRIKNKSKDGTEYWQNSTFVPLYDKKNIITQYISISTIITKEIKFEEELKLNVDQLEIQKNELDQMNQEMKKTEVLKEEFVAMISHELKTPLTPILMWSEALQDKKMLGGLNEKQIKATKTIFNCATELSELISDIFDSYKLDLDKIEFNEHEINLMELMNSTKDTAKKLIGRDNIIIENTTNENITIYSDKKRIDQIFKNLIINAIDFVKEDAGKIEINASVKGEDVEFRVKDNGVGIKKEFQKELFKKFYQIDTSATRKHGGSGLGLSICHGMVKGMKGKIWVESEYGEGTTFYFTLPIVNKTVK